MEEVNKLNMINTKLGKTEAEYTMKSIRFLLLTITTMFIIIAGLMIVLGFSVYSRYHTFSFFDEGANISRFFTPSVLSIIMGIFLLIVTLFGFFGSLKQSTCMVNLYALILALMLIVQLIVVILAFTLSSETLRNYIYIPVSQYTSDPEIEMEIDRLQICLNCCGSDSYLDYVGMDFSANQSTVIVSTQVNGEQVKVVVPESCCISREGDLCNTMRANSCKSALINLFIQNSSVIGVLGVSVMFIQLLGMIFALLLARCIRKVKSERGLMLWKIREKRMLARQNDWHDYCVAQVQQIEEENRKRQSTDANQKDNTIYIPPHEHSTA